MCAHFGRFLVSHLFLRSVRPQVLGQKRSPPTSGARKLMKMPRSSEAPIWKTSTSTGLMFNCYEVWHLSLVVVGIYVEVTPSVGISVGQLPGAEPGFNTKWWFIKECRKFRKNAKRWKLKLKYLLDFSSRKRREMTGQLDFIIFTNRGSTTTAKVVGVLQRVCGKVMAFCTFQGK